MQDCLPPPGHNGRPDRADDTARIIARAADLAGDEGKAIIWFKHQPIPGFGKTAEDLVEAGRADLVMEDLERMADGVYS